MSWEIVFQTITGGFAAIGTWFLYDLVKEFKTFKSDTKKDVDGLKAERANFKNVVRDAELTFARRTEDLRKISIDYTHKTERTILDMDIKLLKISSHLDEASKQSKTYVEFTAKLIAVLKKHEQDLKGLKIEMGDLQIFKTKK